ncbi:MAG: chemotaxis response regulator protein-glutamate methylesterase [Candidatus Omnitrophica bacterium]|nr:chemotaxis response regulator protein-glutamate methylesterase [Candidatus Omnitrophota bacterium]
MKTKIRVLVVDDSFLMRKIISDMINSDPDLEVVDQAKDGQEALEKVSQYRPDVVTLDVNLPLLNGIEVLEEIMKRHPTRVIMLSAYTQPGASATIKALELGAVDFVSKPSGEVSLDLNKLKEEIVYKVKIAAQVDLNKYLFTLRRHPPVLECVEKVPTLRKVIVIGASTGGPKAVLEIMQNIPAGISAAFIIIQHMPQGFTLSFAERISWQSNIKTKEAEDGELIFAGKAYVAPAGYHLRLIKESNQIKTKLTQEDFVNFLRPSVDVTLGSTAEIVGKDTVAVILSGMGKDGLEGVRKVKERGGFVIAQDESTSVIWGMPKSVVDSGLADVVLPVFEIPQAIVEIVEKT